MTFVFDSEVEIDFDFDYKKLYEDVVMACLDAEQCPYEAQVALTLVDDEAIRQINKENRDIDKATDVLSFPMNDYPSEADFSNIEEDLTAFDPDSGELILGDIVISIDHVHSQAIEYGHSVAREFAFLICHSMLHLMGYDHMEDSQRIVMEDHQKIIMESLINKYPELKVN